MPEGWATACDAERARAALLRAWRTARPRPPATVEQAPVLEPQARDRPAVGLHRPRPSRRARSRPAPPAGSRASASGSKECVTSVISSVSWLNSSAWCTDIALVATTPIAWSRTSQPWQYGQCSTPVPQCSRSPSISGSSSTTPAVTTSRRATSRSPSSSTTANPSSTGSAATARAQAHLAAVVAQLGAALVDEVAGSDPVAGEEVVHALGRCVAGLARVDHQHRAPRAGQRDARAQSGRSAADDDHLVVDVHGRSPSLRSCTPDSDSSAPI